MTAWLAEGSCGRGDLSAAERGAFWTVLVQAAEGTPSGSPVGLSHWWQNLPPLACLGRLCRFCWGRGAQGRKASTAWTVWVSDRRGWVAGRAGRAGVEGMPQRSPCMLASPLLDQPQCPWGAPRNPASRVLRRWQQPWPGGVGGSGRQGWSWNLLSLQRPPLPGTPLALTAQDSAWQVSEGWTLACRQQSFGRRAGSRRMASTANRPQRCWSVLLPPPLRLLFLMILLLLLKFSTLNF